MTYVTAGDPDLARSRGRADGARRGGADVIEVGVPFSDPIADGPAIQRASERALAAGSHLGAALELVASRPREIDAPIVLFTYVNPVLRMGIETFVARAAEAGVDGVLLLDLPIEEAGRAPATRSTRAASTRSSSSARRRPTRGFARRRDSGADSCTPSRASA